MISVTLTSGQIKDIISALERCENDAYFNKGDEHLADYYMSIQNQFTLVLEKLQEFVPENRVANLVLAVN